MTLRPARLIAALALLALPAAGLLGCTTTKLDPIRLDAPSVADASIAGPGVDIANLRGNITVRVDPRVERISVMPTIRLDKDGPEHYDLDLVASSIDIQANVEDRGGLPALVVTTTSSRDASEFYVDLDIRIPTAEGLRIRSGGGVIRVSRITGAVDIENVSGPIEVRTDHALTQPVSISTGKGDIYLVVPPQSTGAVALQSFGGQCYLESRSPDASVLHIVAKGNSLTGDLNAGKNPIELTTTDGAVRVWVLDKPLERVALSAYRLGN